MPAVGCLMDLREAASKTHALVHSAARWKQTRVGHSVSRISLPRGWMLLFQGSSDLTQSTQWATEALGGRLGHKGVLDCPVRHLRRYAEHVRDDGGSTEGWIHHTNIFRFLVAMAQSECIEATERPARASSVMVEEESSLCLEISVGQAGQAGQAYRSGTRRTTCGVGTSVLWGKLVHRWLSQRNLGSSRVSRRRRLKGSPVAANAKGDI